MSAYQRIVAWRGDHEVVAAPRQAERTGYGERSVRPRGTVHGCGVACGGRLTGGQHSIFMMFVKLLVWMARQNS